MNFKTRIIFVSLLCIVLIDCNTIHNRPLDWARKITVSKFSYLYAINDSIYRSEQPDSLGFTIIDSIGIKSVLNLRSYHTDCSHIYGLPMKLYNVKINPYVFGDKEIIKALIILKNSPKPILVHCNIGGDRTGVVIAMYRIIFQKWTKEKAILEMKNGGYGFHWIFINMTRYIKKTDIERIKREISNQN